MLKTYSEACFVTCDPFRETTDNGWNTSPDVYDFYRS